MINGFDHPAIAAEDPVTLAEWYQRTLGYAVAARNKANAFLLKSPDDVFLEIMPANDDSRPVRQNATPGLSHLAFSVAEFDIACVALDKAGVEWACDEGEALGGGRVRSFHDLEGNLIQIVQRD